MVANLSVLHMVRILKSSNCVTMRSSRIHLLACLTSTSGDMPRNPELNISTNPNTERSLKGCSTISFITRFSCTFLWPGVFSVIFPTSEWGMSGGWMGPPSLGASNMSTAPAPGRDLAAWSDGQGSYSPRYAWILTTEDHLGLQRGSHCLGRLI